MSEKLGKKKLKKGKIVEKKVEGITLIALVITIILLLILAGVSISMIAGENGILKRANEAKEETEIATEDEQREMAMLEAAMNTELTYFQGAPIPAGFAPTRIPGESTVDEGLVITDSNGNEFVWIPCEYTQEETNQNGNTDAVIYNADATDGDNRNFNWNECQEYYNNKIWYDAQPHTIGKKSIEKYHGFYVARYEAGVPENAPFYASKDGGAYKGIPKINEDNIFLEEGRNVDDYVPVSKKGNQVWNYISQKNAIKVAKNMVNNSDVQSYLMDSHAWNTICRLIEKRDISKDLINSKKWGNYSDNTTTKYEKIKGLWAEHNKSENKSWSYAARYNIGTIPNGIAPTNNGSNRLELATGICEDFKAYNIYDLAGNMSELTTEVGKNENYTEGTNEKRCRETDLATDATRCIIRGNSFDGRGELFGVVYPGVVYPSGAMVNIGFRVVLYLNVKDE